jgi:DNA-binding Lrp family transcriptional regulator
MAAVDNTTGRMAPPPMNDKKERGIKPPLRLDRTDLKILRHLQSDGRITNVELARRAGLSPAPCLRRVRTLEEAGLIQGYRAMLDAAQLGYGVVLFALVGLASQAESELRAFEQQVRRWTLVRECYALSGDADYLLACVAPDLEAAQHFVISELTAAPNVQSVRTMLTLKTVKFEPRVPLAEH